MKFLTNFVFPYLRIHVELSKCLRKVSLNKRLLKCKTFALTPSKLTITCKHVFLPDMTQIYSSTQIYSVHTQTFSFYCHSLHGVTRPSRRFLFSAFAYIGQTVHTDVFLPLTKPAYVNFSTHTQTFTFLCLGLP